MPHIVYEILKNQPAIIKEIVPKHFSPAELENGLNRLSRKRKNSGSRDVISDVYIHYCDLMDEIKFADQDDACQALCGVKELMDDHSSELREVFQLESLFPNPSQFFESIMGFSDTYQVPTEARRASIDPYYIIGSNRCRFGKDILFHGANDIRASVHFKNWDNCAPDPAESLCCRLPNTSLQVSIHGKNRNDMHRMYDQRVDTNIYDMDISNMKPDYTIKGGKYHSISASNGIESIILFPQISEKILSSMGVPNYYSRFEFMRRRTWGRKWRDVISDLYIKMR